MQAANTERDLIIGTVRKFVQNEVIPVASEMEHRNEYPHALVEQMKEMGLFGVNIPEEYGGVERRYHHLRHDLRGNIARMAGPGRRAGKQLRDVRRAGSLRHRGAKAAFLALHGHGRNARRDLPDRIQRGHRSAKHKHHGDSRWRRVSRQRLQDVDHQRPSWQHVPAAGQNRSQRRNRRIAA